HEVSYLPPGAGLDAALAAVFRDHAQVIVVSIARPAEVAPAMELIARIRADRPRTGVIVTGRSVAASAQALRDIGCAIAPDLAAVRCLVLRAAARASRADFSRPAPRSPRASAL